MIGRQFLTRRPGTLQVDRPIVFLVGFLIAFAALVAEFAPLVARVDAVLIAKRSKPWRQSRNEKGAYSQRFCNTASVRCRTRCYRRVRSCEIGSDHLRRVQSCTPVRTTFSRAA